MTANTPDDHELEGCDYNASSEELQVIDDAIAAIDRDEIAREAEVGAAFAKFGLG
jgi:hypothetical protein